MRLFRRDHHALGPEAVRLHAAFEIALTVCDFLAAVLFVIGSVMFLSGDWERAGTYLFIIGSLLFAVSPALKVWREVKLARMGDLETLAKRDER
ncbi:hypothetical protein FHS89_001016 [Rubricella aquisinus]|uniref:YrhK domain-containing protein n=1 Tax=Rubricella aquisinus TaxID=2028108 RepID=A0A840WZC2_9RHOB|nr:YrhK family protein [Rubricella aquisinus]MBB5515006.1 hypothetical protein [Rubricella aquisinus]